jgi:PKD repeat protein
LYPEGFFTSYLWSDGSTADSLIVSEPGTYWVETTDIFGFTSSDTIEVFYPIPDYPSSNFYCPSDSITWYTNLGPDYNYLWSDGSTADSLSIDTPGDYHVEITDTNGCVFQSDTLTFGPDPFESIVTLGPDLNLCSGNILTLEDGDSLAVDYLWNTGSTDSSIILNVTDTYYVDVINANGCEASDTIDITIIGDAPNVIIGLPNTVCEGELFTFEDFSNTTDGSTINSWEWDLNDGTVINAQDSSHVYMNDGAYEVSLTISTTAGCSATDIQQVTAIPKPDLTFVSSNECQNSTVQFNGGQLTPTTISTWEWDFDDPNSGLNNTATGQNVSHIFDSSGDFDVMMFGTDVNGCSDTIIITKTILPSPIVDFDFEEVCEGNTVSFENLTTIDFPGLINSYNWSFGDGTTSGQIEPQKPYNVSGNYVVNLVATGNNGCSGQQSQNIKTHSIPVVDQVVESSCAGINTNFLDNSFVSNGSVAQVDWSIDNDAPITGFSIDEVFEESGSISVQQTVISAFGCSNSATFNVEIEDFLDASFEFSPNAFIAGSPISFNSTSQGAGNYEWTFESIGSSSQPDTSIVFPSSLVGDALTVQLAIENSFGCRDSAIIELPVLERSTDLLIDELFLQEAGGFYTVGARLTNLGTTPINEVDLFLKSSSIPVIKETWNGSLQASESTIYVFTSSPSSSVPFKDTSQNYVCIRGSILAPSLFAEEDLTNNEICKLIEPSQSVVIAPQPNPIGDSYSIKVILSSSEVGTLKVFDAQGRVVDVIFENRELNKGLNLFEVDASQYANGGYTLRYAGENQSRQSKIIKQ